MAAEDQDKTEQPTPYRLEEARKRGEVAKSADLNGTAVMIVFAATMALTAAWVMRSLADATRATLQLAGGKPEPGPALAAWMGETWFPLLQALTPLVLALIVVAVVANVLQTGPVFSFHPVKPDFKRLNPAQVVKRLFSMRTLWELGKVLLKLVMLAIVAWIVFRQMTALAESVGATPPRRLGQLLLSAFVKTSLYVLPILAAVAVLDLLMSRREFTRKLRMSRRELKDEVKKRDGDPEVKAKQKQKIRELLRKARAVNRAAEADVILTNPTHVAVALQYRPATMRAPVVLAKGKGFLAARIRKVATRRGVPMLRSPALARALYAECEIDGAVPEALYARLAPVYRWLFSTRKDAQQHAAAHSAAQVSA
jgi:flagellar biosynthetic protein FlhB